MRKLFIILSFLALSISVFSNSRSKEDRQILDAQRFKPSIGLKGMMTTDTSETLDPLHFGLFVYMHYDRTPFIKKTVKDGRKYKLLKDVFYGDAVLSLGLFQGLELGVVVPFSMYSTGDKDENGKELKNHYSLGDVKVGLKYAYSFGGFGMGLTVDGLAPCSGFLCRNIFPRDPN